MKQRIWIAAAVVALAAAGLAGHHITKTRSATAASASSSAAKKESAKKEAVLEITERDTEVAQIRELVSGLSISGTVKAANSAMVKARVAGELQGLGVREGDRVRAGQVIARVESSEFATRVRQAQQQADAAKAQLDTAQRTLDNNQALVNQGFISTTALDTARNNLNAALANHQAALEAVALARKSQDDAVLRAPISGVVSQRLAQPGERVAPEARIVEIVDLSRLELEVAVPAADAAALAPGQSAEVRIEGIAQPVTAKIVRISPTAQAANRSVMTYFALPSIDGLRQGLFAQGTLGVARVSGVAVPLSAVRTDKPQPYVAAVVDGKVAHLRIGLGARAEINGVLYVIADGVPPGAVILRGSVGSIAEATLVKQATPPNTQKPSTSAAAPAASATAQ